MQGTVGAPGPAGLFFKWYSSLSPDPLSTALDFTASLKTGSHVITFTAKDVAGDSAPDLQSVQRAGFAGGPPIAKPPCIVHVFLANMVLPAADGAVLSKTASTLSVEVPAVWDRPDYQAVNHLQFRWRSAPGGELVPAANQLTFRQVQQGDPGGTLPQLIYTGPLPATGNCTITVRVEDTQDNSIGHEVSRSVVVNP